MCLVNTRQLCDWSDIIGAMLRLLINLGIWLCFLVAEDTITAVGKLSFSHSVLLRVIPQASRSPSPLSWPFLSQKWY